MIILDLYTRNFNTNIEPFFDFKITSVKSQNTQGHLKGYFVPKINAGFKINNKQIRLMAKNSTSHNRNF